MQVFLLPTFLGDHDVDVAFTPFEISKLNEISVFVCENLRTARRHLRKMGYEKSFDDAKMFEMGKHCDKAVFSKILDEADGDVGLISEAGMPAVADPGADFVALAQKRGIRVVPLAGPSAILLALSASGLNGQNFAFCGYLPIDAAEKRRKISALERESAAENRSQIFIETPFRNDRLFAELLANLQSGTRLCVACNVLCDDESIVTKTVAEWKKSNFEIGKRPAIFIILAECRACRNGGKMSPKRVAGGNV